jgi:hypothetical protein
MQVLSMEEFLLLGQESEIIVVSEFEWNITLANPHLHQRLLFHRYTLHGPDCNFDARKILMI